MQSDTITKQERVLSPTPAPGAARATAQSAPRVRQPWARLLKSVLDLAGEQAELLCHVEHDWASATFTGSRHALTLCFQGAAAAETGEAFIVALPDHAFTIPRWLVADAQIVSVDDQQLPQRKLVAVVEVLLLDRA